MRTVSTCIETGAVAVACTDALFTDAVQPTTRVAAAPANKTINFILSPTPKK
jgi:hypothetical protein